MSNARYAYAIGYRNAGLPMTCADLMRVTYRDLACVTRPVLDGGLPVTTDAVLQHEAVVEAVRECGPAVPVRFGTVFSDAAALECSLTEHYDSLLEDLERLGDRVELSLTALAPASRAVTAERNAGGAHYLRARADELRRHEKLQERARGIDQALGQLALERRTSPLPTLGSALRMTYLLEPHDVVSFRSAFELVRSAQDEMRLFLTGPWPPYSFVRTGVTERRTAAQLLENMWRSAPASLSRREGTASY